MGQDWTYDFRWAGHSQESLNQLSQYHVGNLTQST